MRKWAWLIGASDASDGRLVDWAKSFAMPPSLDIRGARLQFSAYAAERRAIRFEVLSNEVEITIKPGTRCINPVFEFENASSAIANVTLAGGAIDADRYAWDGHTLWLDATINAPTELRITFRSPASRSR